MEKKEKNDSNQAEINLLQPMKWNEVLQVRAASRPCSSLWIWLAASLLAVDGLSTIFLWSVLDSY